MSVNFELLTIVTKAKENLSSLNFIFSFRMFYWAMVKSSSDFSCLNNWSLSKEKLFLSQAEDTASEKN